MEQTDAISKSAVIDRIAEFLGPKGLDEWEVMVAIRDIIENAPALDVAPVVHAMWMLDSSFYSAKIFHCTSCNTKQMQISKFCPECGAKMDGEAND